MRLNDSAIDSATISTLAYEGRGRRDGAAAFRKGVACGVGANLVWGLAFLLPAMVAPADAGTLAIGRYLSFGLVSLSLLVHQRRGDIVATMGAHEWRLALLFAFTGHFGYYAFLVFGIAQAGAPIATAIIGVLPVAVALTGNRVRREFAPRRLIVPLVLMAVGLTVVYVIELDWRTGAQGRGTTGWILGVGAVLVALALWTSYSVGNALFLHNHPDLPAGVWSNMMGLCSLGLAVAALPVVFVLGGATMTDPVPLITSSLVLGVVVSWLGTVLWNRASALLPMATAGQLVVVQVIAGLVYVFAWERRVPQPLELAGMLLMVGAVLIALRRTNRSWEDDGGPHETCGAGPPTDDAIEPRVACPTQHVERPIVSRDH